MLLSLHAVTLVIVFASLTCGQKHHKVRHKHNLLNFGDSHVNEIREAFDEYRNLLHEKDKLRKYPSVTLRDEYDDAIDNNLNLSDEIVKKFSSTEKPRKQIPVKTSEIFFRNKRVFTTKTTTSTTVTTQRSIDDDDEYFDDDNDTSNRRPNDDAQVRFSRDNSDNENQLAEGESLTDYKWKTLGTPDGVGSSFQQQQHRDSSKDKRYHVNRNIENLRINGMCRWPSKKIIPMPRTLSTRYFPLSYLIYQCSDDTACCISPEKTCVAKKFEEIELWFRVQHMAPIMRENFESIKVINHTECDCVYKDQASVSRTTRGPYAWPMPTTTKAPSCKCPSFYLSEVDDDGVCGCVCRSEPECKQRYEGKEGFTMSDRRCVQSNECVQPQCLHGTYKDGRCPDKNEKINKGFEGTRARRDSR